MVAGGDFRRMSEISWWGTCIFYWTWLALSFIILMNIVISILTESHIAATRVIGYIEEFKLDEDNIADEQTEDNQDDENSTESDDDADDHQWDPDRVAALENLLRTMLQDLPPAGARRAPGPAATPCSTSRALWPHNASGGLASSYSSEAIVNPEAEPEFGPDPEPALVLNLLQRLGLEEKVISEVRDKLLPQSDKDVTAREASAAAREARAD